jgi:hypothetical protein
MVLSVLLLRYYSYSFPSSHKEQPNLEDNVEGHRQLDVRGIRRLLFKIGVSRQTRWLVGVV